MTPLRTLIVDDEQLARETIRRLLAGDPEIEIAGECASGTEAVRALRESAPDLLFLDVQMPEVDGFEVLRRARPSAAAAVVFVTAYDAYALRAFETEALDYLLKPFDDDRFHRTLARAKARVREQRVTRLAGMMADALETSMVREPTGRYAERLGIRRGSGIVFVELDDVDWIEAADYCVRIHVGGRFHLLREPLRELEARLDPRRFFRVHRSAIVNLARVRELQPHFHGDGIVVMRDGASLRVSRARRSRLHQVLGLEA